MTKHKAEFDDLLTLANLADLRAAIAAWRAPISVPQAIRLGSHAKSLGSPTLDVRLGIIHTYTSDLLDPWLEMASALQGVNLHTFHAPHGLALQEARAGSALLLHRPDITLLMLRREDLHPDLDKPVVGFGGEAQARLRADALARLREIVDRFRAEPVGRLVITLLPAMSEPALGCYDAQAEASEALWWATFKAELARWMRESLAASSFLDLDDVLLRVGREAFFDRRYWYTAQFPFAQAAAREIARRVLDLGVVLKAPRAKVLVLDADNTLWGGIVGEDGFDGIALGLDYPGVAFRDFQRRILDFQQRGFILALCSKNNPDDVDRVLRDHPHQILRDRHFAARRVNWLPKTQNLLSLAEELDLGLESFVFVDDSEHECAAVHHAFPQIEVIRTPTRAVDVPTCLDRVARLEVLTLTSEDAARTELYAQQRRRRELGDSIVVGGGGIRDYLERLDMKMQVHLNAAGHLARLAQLTQKTNQFNLTTRRYDEQRMLAFIEAEDWLVADFSLADVFGDSGIVGLAMWRRPAPRRAVLDTFLMSCRVIGREAEGAFLHALLRHLAGEGVTDIEADFVATAKNAPARSFLPEQGFECAADGRYRRDLRSCAPLGESSFPIEVDLHVDHAQGKPRVTHSQTTRSEEASQ